MDQVMTDAAAAQPGAPAAPAAPSAPAAPPVNAAEARTVLDARMGDKSWGAKLFAGDVAVTTEYRGLRELINKPDLTGEVAAAMSGDPHPSIIQDSRAVELRGSAGFLRDLGLNEQQVKETLEGKEPSQAEIEMAKQWKAQTFKSKEFVNRLFAGDAKCLCPAVARGVAGTIVRAIVAAKFPCTRFVH
jgi:hypothetical protein